jgi:hypothetical protein
MALLFDEIVGQSSAATASAGGDRTAAARGK